MSFKLLSLVVPGGLGALWYGGALGGGYERVVDRPAAEVIAALADWDVREQPGSPGTDPARAGGVAPVFVTEPRSDRISFVVMSGGEVAIRMTAFVEPIDGGARTRVTAAVERGDAPDEFVSPAFRSGSRWASSRWPSKANSMKWTRPLRSGQKPVAPSSSG